MSIFRLSRMLNAWIAAHPLFALDRAPFWSLCLAPLVLAILAVAVWRPARAWKRPRAAVFFGLILAVLLLARLPLLCYDYFNADEAFMLASAMRLTTDPVANRSADTISDGALDSYVLTLPALAGQPLTYVTSRLTAVAEVFGTLVFLWLTYRLFLAEWLAGLVLMPAFCFFAFAGESDFVHCSSEHLPMFLSAPAVYLLVRLYRSDSPPGWWRWAAIGVLAGAMPFGKLQALPLAGMLLLLGTALAWSKPATEAFQPLFNRRGALAALWAGSAATSALFAAMLLSTGAFQEFWLSYIGHNIMVRVVQGGILYNRGAGMSGSARVRDAIDLLFNVSSLGAYASALLLVWLAGLLACLGVWLARRRVPPPAPRKPVRAEGLLSVASVLLLVAGSLSVATPGREYPHYLIFLIIPFGLLTAAACAWIAVTACERQWKPILRQFAVVLFVCLTCVWPNVARLDWADAWDTPHFPPESPLVRAIQRYCPPQDRLVVWGWRSELHLASNRIPGTRFADSLLADPGRPQPRVFSRPVYGRFPPLPPCRFRRFRGLRGLLFHRSRNGRLRNLPRSARCRRPGLPAIGRTRWRPRFRPQRPAYRGSVARSNRVARRGTFCYHRLR